MRLYHMAHVCLGSFLVSCLLNEAFVTGIQFQWPLVLQVQFEAASLEGAEAAAAQCLHCWPKQTKTQLGFVMDAISSDIDDIFATAIANSSSLSSSTNNISSSSHASGGNLGIRGLPIEEQLQYHQQALAALEQVLSQKKRGRPNYRLIAENQEAAIHHREAIAALQQQLPPEQPSAVIEMPTQTLGAWQILMKQQPATVVPTSSPFLRPMQQNHIVEAFQLVQNGSILPDNYDEDILKLWTLLKATAHTTQKIEALAATVGTNHDKLISALRALGSTLEHLSQQERFDLENLTGSCVAPANRIQYLDLRSYDETPLWLTQVIDLAKLGEAPVLDTASDNNESAIILPIAASTLRVPASPVKVVVFRAGYSMLLKIGGEYVSISGRTAAGIKVAKQLTGPTMAQLALNSSAATPISNTFKSTGTIPLTDSHASNLQGEQLIKHKYRPSWWLDHLTCEVHPQATVHRIVFDLEAGFTSGVCWIGLMHKQMTYHDIFIQCVMDEIDHVLDIEFVDVFPVPDPDAIAYKRFQLKCFFSRGSNNELRKALILRSLPGDWRSDRIVFPVLRSVGPIPESIVRTSIKHGVKLALFGRRCPIYNTSDWTNADLALDWIGAVEAPYRLYSRSMARFHKVMTSTKKHLLCLVNSSVAALPLEDLAPLTDNPSSSSDADKTDGDEHRKRVAKAIFEASNFSDRQLLLGRLMRGRILMEGLREGMADRLVVGSKPWEKSQLALVARAIYENETHKRQYPLTVSAQMCHEKLLFQRLQHIGESEGMWKQIPNESRTVAFRCTTFRMSSRSGCATEWYFCKPHRLPPYPLFLRLTDEPNAYEIARQAAGQCKHLNDDFTNKLLRISPNLAGEECDAMIEHFAQNTKTNTSYIEILNGRLRKEAVSKVNTHKISVPDLGAMWNIRDHKDDKPAGLDHLGQVPGKQVDSSKAKPCRRRKARLRQMKNPGLARMFFRVVASGKEGTVQPSAVWSLYRELLQDSPEDERLQKARRLLESELRAVQHADGMSDERKCKPSRLQQLVKRRLRRQKVKQLVEGADGHQRSLALVNSMRGGDGTAGGVKTLARIAQQELGKKRKLVDEADNLKLREYAAGVGNTKVQKLVASGLVPSEGLVSLPSIGAVSRFWYTGPHVAQTGNVAAALSKAWKSGVNKALAQEFVAKHQPEQQDPKMVGAVPALPKVHECKQAGICVCTPATRPRLRFRNALYGQVKAHFKPGTPERTKLSEAFIVFKLDGRNITTNEEQVVFAHVGFLLLSPYRLTFNRLTLHADPGELRPRPGRVYLSQTYKYAFDFLFLEQLPRDMVEWNVTFYELESTQEVVEYLRPDPVPALPMFDGQAFKFWGLKDAKCKVDLGEVSKAVSSICDMYADPEDVDGGSGDGVIGDCEDGVVDEYEGDAEEPKSELDKLLDEVADEDLNLGGAEDDNDSASDDAAVDLLKDLSGSGADGSAATGSADVVCGGAASSSGASSSGSGAAAAAAPAPASIPPPASDEQPSKKGRMHVGALACCEVTGGYVSFYSKGVFEAVCKNKSHGSCVASRTVSQVVDPKLGRPRGGRPLGFLVSWLAKHDCSTKAEHWSIENFTARQDERFLCRLGLQDSPDGNALLSCEREQQAGESVEPSDEDIWEYLPRGYK